MTEKPKKTKKRKKHRTRPDLLKEISQLEAAQIALGRSQEELRQSEARYHELADLLPESVFEIDASGMVTFANQRVFEVTGYTQEDVDAGLHIGQLAADEDKARVMENLVRILSGEPQDDEEYTVVRKDGSTLPGLVLAGPIERDGEMVGVRAIALDMTERKEAERQLARRADELEQANRELARLHIAKDEFMAAVSHQLRTPLVTGMGYVDLLLEGSLGEVSEEVRRAMEIAARNLRRLANLVDDVLSYHSLLREDLRETPSPASFDLVDLCRECVAEQVIRTGRSMDTVRIEAQDELPRVWADPEMIRRVLSNLLENALRHAGESADPRVGIQLVDDGEIEVTVRDQGRGMSRRIRERAFEPFGKAQGNADGSGLGLAIVRSILEAHGQEVALDSEEGQGTCVVFRLPVAGDGEWLAAGEQAGGEAGRILVLEDDRDMAEFLKLALGTKGYRVRTARSGDEALALLEDEPADLILVDLLLPGMSGEEFCRAVRKRGSFETTRLYLMTGRSEGAVRARAEAAGCDGYLIKPIALADLLELIRKGLEGGR